ncbi:hypothetical protein [Aldersonia kunmingensis]|uniref:hypothetical protein n=1 Tax=Aldersonia kunmingensis TaxID=408066 RepID=UPI00082F067B|nr:hypothetical protein [Aldersonia kunmingensis]
MTNDADRRSSTEKYSSTTTYESAREPQAYGEVGSLFPADEPPKRRRGPRWWVGWRQFFRNLVRMVAVFGLGLLAIALIEHFTDWEFGGHSSRKHHSSHSSSHPHPAGGSPAAPTTTATPTVPGFHVVTDPFDEVAYDVPGDWIIEHGSESHGFARNGDEMKAVTSAWKELTTCGERAISLLRGSFLPYDPDLASDSVVRAARLAYGVSEVAPRAESFTSTAGVSGVLAQVHGNAGPDERDCPSTGFTVYAFVFGIGPYNTAHTLVVALDDPPGTKLDTKLARRIASTVRPLPGGPTP